MHYWKSFLRFTLVYFFVVGVAYALKAQGLASFATPRLGHEYASHR